jgi:hypothetical protein
MKPDPDDPPSIDDIRVIVREIGKHWQLGNHDIVRRARSLLLRLLRASAKKLLAEEKRRRAAAAPQSRRAPR